MCDSTGAGRRRRDSSGRDITLTSRRAGWIAASALVAAYLSTMAPGVTFWDAGEFIAAVNSFGIPHPPGTPLFIALGRVWTLASGATLGVARAMNLLSAVSTAVAGGVMAWTIAQNIEHERDRSWGALAGVLCAGLMTSVWANATETEVYAISLLHVALMFACAQRAGDGREPENERWVLCTAYLIALAPAVHLSALVGVPAVITLAARDRNGAWMTDRILLLFGVLVATAGVGRMSWVLVVVGGMIAASSIMTTHDGDGARRRTVLQFVATAMSAVIAFSALFLLLVRARHDPAINQGNPSTISALVDVVARHQYDVAPLWPRRAPIWLQIATLGQYVDWQMAMSWGAGIFTTPARLFATILFLALGVIGFRTMRRDARRLAESLLMLTVCGSIGVCVYLNLKSGASIGYGFVPAGAHEARERDYFFVLGFWGWGIFAGYGGLALARAAQSPSWIAVTAAAVPLIANFSTNDRSRGEEATAARDVAQAILADAPPKAVLFLSGDNDSYPIWYLQQVEHQRPDVSPVTLPLLSANWYGPEIARRLGLTWRESTTVAGTKWVYERKSALIAAAARAAGRPVAVSAEATSRERSFLGSAWTLHGTVYISAAPQTAASEVPAIDGFSGSYAGRRRAAVERPHTALPDDVSKMMLALLDCPKLGQPWKGTSADRDSLEVSCNLR